MSIFADGLRDVADAVNKSLDANVAVPGAEHCLSDITDRIPTSSVMLNILLDGGVPVGRMMEIFGDPSHGKSTIIEHMMIGFQRFPGISVLLDSESGWHRARALRMGHDIDRHLHLQADTVELGFKAINEVIDRLRMPGKFPLSIPVGFFWDTISASQTEGEKEGDQYKDGMGDKARKIRQALRHLSLKLPQTNCALVFVSQTITDIKAQQGRYVVKKSAAGGDAISFWSSKRIKVWYTAKIDYPVENSGILSTVRVIKDKTCAPNIEVTLPIMYDTGIDSYYEVLNYLLDNSSWVNMRGPRVVVPDFPEPGEELTFYTKQLYSTCAKHPELLDYMRTCAISTWQEKHGG